MTYFQKTADVELLLVYFITLSLNIVVLANMYQ